MILSPDVFPVMNRYDVWIMYNYIPMADRVACQGG